MADVEGEIVLCFECGAKNRLKPGWSGAPVCGKCGEPLPVQARTTYHAGGSTRTPTSKKGGFLFKAMAGIALVAVISYAIIDDQLSSKKKVDQNPSAAYAPSAQTAAPATTQPLNTTGLVPVDQTTAVQEPPKPALKAVAVKPGIILKNTKGEFIAPFEIRTSPGANYFVKLVDVGTGKSVVGIYVIGGRALEVKVPLGRYEMRYASGETWYGLKHLFGDDQGQTTYSKADDIFDFAVQGNQVSGYTVELIRQTNGNLETRQIDASEF